jgi:hypothetical protein
VCDKPDIVCAHVLINVYKYQNPRQKNAEQDVGDLRHCVRRVKIRKKKNVNQQNYPRKK